MLTDFIAQQMKKARVKLLDDGSYFASIPNLKGVWASGSTRAVSIAQLREVLEEWIVLKLKARETIPGFRQPRIPTYRGTGSHQYA